MDVEAVVARRLMDATGIPAFLEVPPDTPDEFLTVEQTGGGGMFLEPFQLDVDCFAQTRKRAKAMSKDVSTAVYDLDEEPNIFHPTVENTYRMPDPDTGTPRYVVQIQVWVCE